MMKLLYGFMACAALLLVASLSVADDKLPANDREFLVQMATAGHADVKFSELVDKRSTNEKVREFAARMTKEHGEANKKLAEHAKNQKVAVVAGFEKDKRDTYLNLSRLNGDEFDRAYMDQMVADHEKAVKVLENEAKNGMDPDLKKFAEETLEKVREHLKHAKEVRDSLKK